MMAFAARLGKNFLPLLCLLAVGGILGACAGSAGGGDPYDPADEKIGMDYGNYGNPWHRDGDYYYGAPRYFGPTIIIGN